MTYGSSPLRNKRRSGWHARGVLEDEVRASEGWEVRDPLTASRLDVVGFTRIARPRPESLERSNVEVYSRFSELRMEWTLGTQTMSSSHDMAMHPAYQQIIGLGPQVVPFIIDELRSSPDHWFWALTSIVGTDHGFGSATIREAAARWVDWFDTGK